MDASTFDRWTRTLGQARSRRRALAAVTALVASVLPALASEASDRKGHGQRRHKHRPHGKQRGNGKGKGNGNGKGKGQGTARRPQAEAVCFPGSPCTVGAGKNLAKCDLANSSSLQGANCTGCNLDSANLTKANASGANLKGANLGKACLVDTNLSGAKLTNANTKGAIFCRTTMPDGSLNTSGCGNATSCCPTCNVALGSSCSAVGAVCCGGGSCQGGVCVCPAGRTNCAGTCVNLQTDRRNCGSCGATCGAGERCCGGVCINVQSDPANCGSCGATCGAGERCCEGSCTNLQSDPANCGSCGATCGAGERCCEGVCKNVQSDPANCGSCGATCAADQLCQQGSCVCDEVACAATGGCCVGDSCVADLRQWLNQTTFGRNGTGASQFRVPRGVAVAADEQTVWVADTGNHRISVWTESGGVWSNQTTFGSFGSGASQFNAPFGVVVAADGKTVWVADTGNYRISVWTESGGVWSNQTTFGSFGSGASQFSLPRGVAVAADGKTVWVADTGNNRIPVWTRSGGVWSHLTTFGSLGTGPSQFSLPFGVAVAADGQTVWVADTDNHRISVWAFTCPAV